MEGMMHGSTHKSHIMPQNRFFQASLYFLSVPITSTHDQYNSKTLMQCIYTMKAKHLHIKRKKKQNGQLKKNWVQISLSIRMRTMRDRRTIITPSCFIQTKILKSVGAKIWEIQPIS